MRTEQTETSKPARGPGPGDDPLLKKRWGMAETASAIFDLSESTLRRAWSDGRIRSAKVRGRGTERGKRLYDLDSIESWLNSLVAPPPTKAEQPAK